MVQHPEFNSNGFQAPKLEDYLGKIKEFEIYTKIKIQIPHNFNERMTWQPFEDEIVLDHVDKYITDNNGFFKDIKNLSDLKDKIIDTANFFSSKDFSNEWINVSTILWDTHLKRYLELITLIKNEDIDNIPEHLHYLISRSSTIISLQDLLKKRRSAMIKKRWLNVLDPYLKKGKWSKEEDEFLLEKFRQYGPMWSKIASEVPRRTVDQCSKRFSEALDPEKDLKNYVNWTESEDIFLINQMNNIGTKWRTIAMDLSKALQSNRSALNCRNRWRTLINSYIKNRNNSAVHMLLADLTVNGEFKDIVKLREKLVKQNIEKEKKKEYKEQKKILKTKNKKKKKKDLDNDHDGSVDDDKEDENIDNEDDFEDDEDTQQETPLDYKNFKMMDNTEPPFNTTPGFLIKDDKHKFNYSAKNFMNAETNNKLNGGDTMSNVDEPHTAYQWNRITPSIASNNMDSQYEQQYSQANSIAALSPGQYHMSMSPPQTGISLMQTPKPHDIISSLRTTQNKNIMNSPPSLLSNLVSANVNTPNNMNDVFADKNYDKTESITNTSNNTINKKVNKTFLQKSQARPSSVPLNNNTTEWKFQLKQKNLTLSSGNITNEKLVGILIEQAKLNNLKISIHQHIHNHYVPILDNSEQESNTNQTTPESTIQKFSNNSISSSNSSNNFGNKVVKDMNEIGGYRTKHFKQLDSKKLPKLGSSYGVKRKGSVTGSSPRRSGSMDMSGKSVQLNNKRRKSYQFGTKTTSEESEAYDFFDSLMDTNNKNNESENDDDLYMLGFNPS